jgi:hypothetical protein
MAGAAQARPAFLPPGKAFGFNANLYAVDEPPGQISSRTLDAAQAAGAEYLRMGIVWRQYENETNVDQAVPPSFGTPIGQPTSNPQTNTADAQYQAIVARGMTPVLIVHSAPYWASTFHTCLTNPIDRLNSTKCPPDWRTNANVLYAAPDRFSQMWSFVAAVARRYPAAVMEGTNEPDFQQASQARYHPKIDVVADGQCVLAGAVRSVDPSRKVLSSGLYIMDYAKQYLARLSNRNCYDAFSTHIGGSSEVRSWFGSGVQARLQEIRYLLNLSPGPSKRIWITETGLSDTFELHKTHDLMGEPLVATAFPRWVTTLVSEADVDGILVHTVREGAAGEFGQSFGYGNLKPDYSIKPAGSGTMPRFCWLVLQNASTWPGCESWFLTTPEPRAAWFYWVPELQWPEDPQADRVARVLFLELGEPLPNVSITWYRCNSLGLGCVASLTGTTGYQITSADRYKKIKAEVIITNPYGTVAGTTVLSPLVT